MTVEVFAPAKINLTLHITGQRPDGYHLIDSLVVFAGVGDTVRAVPAVQSSLTIEGPEGGGLSSTTDNLVLRAANLYDGASQATHITLTKRLPVASGIGGGSSDAAATIRALEKLWKCARPSDEKIASLGADVPVCMMPVPQRMTGIGEICHSAPKMPDLDILLVNPRVAVETRSVFARLPNKRNPPMPETLPEWQTLDDLSVWLAGQRNDLQKAAISLHAEIGDALDLLAQTGPAYSAMSGSGATCFALYQKGDGSIEKAEQTLRDAKPDWWVVRTTLL